MSSQIFEICMTTRVYVAPPETRRIDSRMKVSDGLVGDSI